MPGGEGVEQGCAEAPLFAQPHLYRHLYKRHLNRRLYKLRRIDASTKWAESVQPGCPSDMTITVMSRSADICRTEAMQAAERAGISGARRTLTGTGQNTPTAGEALGTPFDTIIGTSPLRARIRLTTHRAGDDKFE